MSAAGPDERRGAAVARLLATTAAVVAGEVILWRAGSTLPSLPLDPAGLRHALDEADPLALAGALLRLAALAAGAGLLAATALGIVARACGAARVTARLDRWTPRTMRRLLDGALGAGLAASIGLGAVPAGADPGSGSPPPGAVLRRLPDGPPATLRHLPDGPPAAAEPQTTLRRLPDAPPALPAPPRPPPAPVVPVERRTTARSYEVVVRPGDSFWTIAERREAERLGRRPTEREVGACWQELVAANRHRLVVPGDPDLIFPGQTFVVPCP